MKLEGTWEWEDGADPQLRLRLGNQIAVFPLGLDQLKNWSAVQWLDVLEGRLRALAAIDACPHDDWSETAYRGLKQCGRCGVVQGTVVIP